MQNKFIGEYEYMGFMIYNGESKHIWDIEPLWNNMNAIEKFKSQSPSFKTLAQAKKWLKENANNISEIDYI